MCNGRCSYFQKSIPDDFHYCQQCAKFVGIRYLYREEKVFGRLRCSCCNGLVRNKKRNKQKLITSVKSLAERGFVVKNHYGETLNGDSSPSHMKN